MLYSFVCLAESCPHCSADLSREDSVIVGASEFVRDDDPSDVLVSGGILSHVGDNGYLADPVADQADLILELHSPTVQCRHCGMTLDDEIDAVPELS